MVNSKASKKLWFKSKRYGWGWQPASIEGWIVTLGFMASLLLTSIYLDPLNPLYIVLFTMQIVVLIAICYKTGEKPEWRWGDPKKKKS